MFISWKCFLTYHRQTKITHKILTEYSLELRVRLPLLNHGQVVPERAQTRLELVVVEAAGAVLVEVLEHHRELLQRVLAYTWWRYEGC